MKCFVFFNWFEVVSYGVNKIVSFNKRKKMLLYLSVSIRFSAHDSIQYCIKPIHFFILSCDSALYSLFEISLQRFCYSVLYQRIFVISYFLEVMQHSVNCMNSLIPTFA